MSSQCYFGFLKKKYCTLSPDLCDLRSGFSVEPYIPAQVWNACGPCICRDNPWVKNTLRTTWTAMQTIPQVCHYLEWASLEVLFNTCIGFSMLHFYYQLLGSLLTLSWRYDSSHVVCQIKVRYQCLVLYLKGLFEVTMLFCELCCLINLSFIWLCQYCNFAWHWHVINFECWNKI